VAIMSYDGGINFGLLGDYDALPDIEVIGAGIEESLAELRAAAAERAAAGNGRRGRPRAVRSSSGPGSTMRAKSRGAKPARS
jgi:diacylglycerol O-acyltransferase / wax synthase